MHKALALVRAFGNWVRFAFLAFGCWLLAFGLVELGSFRVIEGMVGGDGEK